MNKKWTQYEKNVFLTLLQSSGVVNKNKKLNAEIFKWHSIQKKFQQMTGTEVSAEELKNKWREMIVSAKSCLQLGNVSSSEYIKVLAICMGIYSEVNDPLATCLSEDLNQSSRTCMGCSWKEKLHQTTNSGTLSCPFVRSSRKKSKFSVELDFDMNKIRTELQVEFQPPELSFERDENLGSKLIEDVCDREASSAKKKRKMEENGGSGSGDGKKRTFLKEEFELKKLHLEKELQHQAVKHKMEIEILDLKRQIMLKRLDRLNKSKIT